MEDNKEHKRIIIMLAIIVLIILLLISSCSCSALFWGKIGDMFTNEKDVVLNGDSDKELNINGSLKFDTLSSEMFESDENLKISFSYDKIAPTSFSCTTSDASIATCYVENNSVVVKPKKAGEVIVTLETETNNMCFRATTKVTIKEANRYLSLTSNYGTIDLSYSNELIIGYILTRLDGEVSVLIEDNKICDVTINNGSLIITGKNIGSTKITLKINYKGKDYYATFNLNVIKSSSNNQSSPENKPSNNPTNPELSNDSYLKSLSSSIGNISFAKEVLEYFLSVSYDVQTISFKAVLSDENAKIYYGFNNQDVRSLDDLKLKVGENEVTILVTAPDGSSKTYKITIIRSPKPSSNDSYLANLWVSKGNLNPNFNRNVFDYLVSVSSSINKIDVYYEKSDNKAQVSFEYKGKVVNDLKDLPLDFGKNIVKIILTAEDGSKTVYTVIIERTKSHNNNLSNLEVLDNLKLNEEFAKDKNKYTLNVPYNKDKVSFKATLEDQKSKVTYKFNGEYYKNLNDLPLVAGDNKLEIVVTSEAGEVNTYEVTIHKPVRTINILLDKYTIDIDEAKPIMYEIYEDGRKLKTSEYNKDDVKFKIADYNGYIINNLGNILLKPSRKMLGEERTITVTYANSFDEALINFVGNPFYLESYLYEYYVSLLSTNNDRDIILNTNFFIDNVRLEETSYGVRLVSNDNEDIYIDLTFDKSALNIVKVTGSNSIDLVIKVLNAGNFDINVNGTAIGENINFIIKIHALEKYILTLDSGEGYFDEFTTKYYLPLAKDEELDLTEYFKGYKEVDCKYYPLIGFSDGVNVYNSSNPKIKISKDTVLKALYSEEKVEEIKEEKIMYLTDVDLFHNEEYFKMYGIDKIVYPGAKGSYIMTFNNNMKKDIYITDIILEEDYPICVSNGCLNMGYVLKDVNEYYFANNRSYRVLNNHLENIKVPLLIPSNGKSEISLLWKWLELNDQVDTDIGNLAATKKLDYSLIVGIKYEVVKDECEARG